MKGILTFTLAAGVAITTTSVAQAAGVGKGAMNADRIASTQTQAPMSVGALGGLVLDRVALSRELARLSDLLAPTNTEDDVESTNSSVQRKSVGNWTGL